LILRAEHQAAASRHRASARRNWPAS
jgi:hypothetical protein